MSISAGLLANVALAASPAILDSSPEQPAIEDQRRDESASALAEDLLTTQGLRRLLGKILDVSAYAQGKVPDWPSLQQSLLALHDAIAADDIPRGAKRTLRAWSPRTAGELLGDTRTLYWWCGQVLPDDVVLCALLPVGGEELLLDWWCHLDRESATILSLLFQPPPAPRPVRLGAYDFRRTDVPIRIEEKPEIATWFGQETLVVVSSRPPVPEPRFWLDHPATLPPMAPGPSVALLASVEPDLVPRIREWIEGLAVSLDGASPGPAHSVQVGGSREFWIRELRSGDFRCTAAVLRLGGRWFLGISTSTGLLGRIASSSPRLGTHSSFQQASDRATGKAHGILYVDYEALAVLLEERMLAHLGWTTVDFAIQGDTVEFRVRRGREK